MRNLPSPAVIDRIRRDALLVRAIEAYKFFYPTVSMVMNYEALVTNGAEANRGFLIQLTTPAQVSLTQNSDTPYGLGWIDVEAEPIVVEVPAGPTLGVVNDTFFQYVTDLGLVGEEEGAGATYLFVAPDYHGEVPDGFLVRRLRTHRALIATRAPFPDPAEGKALLQGLRVYPLSAVANPEPTQFRDTSEVPSIANPCEVDGTFAVWEVLKRALDMEVPPREFYNSLGMLADLGIRKDVAFDPSAEMIDILTEAARLADEQLVVAAFASRDPERLVWADRRWEWVVFSEGESGYYEADFLRLSVRERWFYQATLETPKMFRHSEGSGSLYWLGNLDVAGDALDGGNQYRLTIPSPVPAAQFWSVTVYDLDTRSEIDTPQFTPLITSLRDQLVPDAEGNVVLHFGPEAPSDLSSAWVQTLPGAQWFAYFRLYGPGAQAFDGSWKPSDFTRAGS